MSFSKLNIILISLFAIFAFNGCSQYEQALVSNALIGNTTSSYGNPYYYNGYNYGSNRDSYYRRGIQDGCRSRRGNWVKNSYNYRNRYSYRNGWNAGYNQCRRNSYNNYYRQGNRDGCQSAYRHWRKNRYKYNHSSSYRNGWNQGYTRCRRYR